jgi:hypothetical protein
MEGQTRRQIGKGLNLHCFSLAMEFLCVGLLPKERKT